MSRRLRILAGAGAAAALPPLAVRGAMARDRPAAAGGVDLASAEARGYARGLEDGRSAAETEVRESADRTARTLDGMTGDLDRLLEAIEAQAVHAALRVGLEVAKRILEREVAHDPEVIERTVAAALDRLPGASEIEIHLDPLDLETLTRTSALGRVHGRGRVRFVPDPSVGRGGCVVRSDAGLVDARLEAQLRAAAACLFGPDDGPSPAGTAAGADAELAAALGGAGGPRR